MSPTVPNAPIRLFGFPIRLGGHALVFSLIILGLAVATGDGLGDVVSFVSAVVPVVIVHELGHAFEARRASGSPVITIFILGGQTDGIPSSASDWRLAWISAAVVAYTLVFFATSPALAITQWPLQRRIHHRFPPPHETPTTMPDSRVSCRARFLRPEMAGSWSAD